MPKQTLYEFLGVAADATDEKISARCRLHRKVIDSHADMADRNNQLLFLQHAEQTLLNPDRRARYDRQLRQEAESAAPRIVSVQAAPSRWGRVLAATLLLSAGALAWGSFGHYLTRSAVPAQSASPRLATKPSIESPADMAEPQTTDSPPIAADGPRFVAQSREEQTTLSTEAVPPPQAVVQYTVKTSGPYAPLLGKLTWSVFAILGPKALGTGVLVDDEKLLTNCHVIAHNTGPGNKIYAINSVTRQRVEITRVAYMTYRGEDACLVIAPGLKGKPVALGDFYSLRQGAMVHNIGFAQGRLRSSDGSFLGIANINGQAFIQSSNYCDHGVSGGPLVDDNGGLVGLTTGGPADRDKCYSLTIETAKRVLYEPTVGISEFPTDYLSNIIRR